MNKDCKKEKVLVVIVTYNGMQWLERCLDSLKNQATVDAIVIDNGSTDGSVEYIRERHPEVELIATGKNLGFGAANNIGMKKALRDGYAGVYLLNQDAWIFDDTIPVLMAVSRKYPEYGILSPIQLSGDGITPDFGFRKACFRAFEEDGEIVEVPFSMAAHWYIPADALRLVGGFSPTFFHYGEDNNYVERMRWHGKKIGVAIKAKGVHDRNERPTPKEKEMYLKDVSNLIRMSSPGGNGAVNVMKGLFYAGAFAMKSRSFSPIKGIWNHLRRYREIEKNREESRKPGAFLN